VVDEGPSVVLTSGDGHAIVVALEVNDVITGPDAAVVAVVPVVPVVPPEPADGVAFDDAVPGPDGATGAELLVGPGLAAVVTLLSSSWFTSSTTTTIASTMTTATSAATTSRCRRPPSGPFGGTPLRG
jgi:hypothetical protein